MTLKLAVIGAGVMGTNHARVASTVAEFDLAWIVDADGERAKAAAAAHGASAETDPMAVIGQVDAAIVALPTKLHAEVAVPLLEAGVHCLVEKPLAGEVDDAQRIIDAAQASGAILAVGHVERFNPAILELDKLVGDVVHVEAQRVGPFSARVADSVVIDLMIHDLDLVRSLAGGEAESVTAISQRLHTDNEDLATALLHFDSGVTAVVTASRLGQQKTRELRITQPDSQIVVDLMRTDVTVHRVEHAEFTGPEGTVYRQQGVVEIPMVETRGEPLWLEQREFAVAINEEREPRVGGNDGLEALKLALRVVEVCRSTQDAK
ncbi:MAG: Gfo/Idh/MocA family oxidoreductase [Microthrixaceae bacterium]